MKTEKFERGGDQFFV